MNEVYYIAEDKTLTQYAIRGRDPVSGRLWLATTEKDYEAYDGDLILSPAEAYDGDLVLSPVQDETYNVVMADSRTSLPRRIHLKTLKTPEKRLANHVLSLICRVLADNNTPSKYVIQHGDGMINADAVVVGDSEALSVAVLQDGRVEICDEYGNHRWFDVGEMDEMFNDLMAGRLNSPDRSATK